MFVKWLNRSKMASKLRKYNTFYITLISHYSLSSKNSPYLNQSADLNAHLDQ